MASIFQPYLYQTFKQLPKDRDHNKVYLQVISIQISGNERTMLTLLNLDGSLSTKKMTPKDFSILVHKGIIEAWKPY